MFVTHFAIQKSAECSHSKFLVFWFLVILLVFAVFHIIWVIINLMIRGTVRSWGVFAHLPCITSHRCLEHCFGFCLPILIFLAVKKQFYTLFQGRSAFSRLHKKWKVFVGVNSSNSAPWNEEVDIGYLPMDHLP